MFPLTDPYLPRLWRHMFYGVNEGELRVLMDTQLTDDLVIVLLAMGIMLLSRKAQLWTNLNELFTLPPSSPSYDVKRPFKPKDHYFCRVK